MFLCIAASRECFLFLLLRLGGLERVRALKNRPRSARRSVHIEETDAA